MNWITEFYTLPPNPTEDQLMAYGIKVAITCGIGCGTLVGGPVLLIGCLMRHFEEKRYRNFKRYLEKRCGL